MAKEMVISANPHETRVAIMEEGLLCEYYVEREKEFALVGSIYKGRVTRVLPGMQSSFVDIGLDSDAFLYVTDFLEGIEELDEHVATIAGDKTPKALDHGSQPFVANDAAAPAFETDVESAPYADASGSAHDAPEAASAPQIPVARPTTSQPPPFNSAPPNRGRFDNRNRHGRDSGRRGGRGGNRFGRRGAEVAARRDQRYGRELPSSKYASSGASAGANDYSSDAGERRLRVMFQ